jgi:hypothetical protein
MGLFSFVLENNTSILFPQSQIYKLRVYVVFLSLNLKSKNLPWLGNHNSKTACVIVVCKQGLTNRSSINDVMAFGVKELKYKIL